MRKYKSLFIGLAAALLCALCVGLYLTDVQKAAARAQEEALEQYGSETVEVCVAKRDIAAAESLDSFNVETRLWVASLLPDDAFTDITALVGKEAGQPIYAGEVITSHRVGTPSYTLDIPYGYSAVSLPVRDVQALGRALKPGMRADIYATGAATTTLMVRRALILATSYGEASPSSSSSSAWITVAVLPHSVEEMVAAAQNLELYFVLPEASSSENSLHEDLWEDRALKDNFAEDATSASHNEPVEGPSEKPQVSLSFTAPSRRSITIEKEADLNESASFSSESQN